MRNVSEMWDGRSEKETDVQVAHGLGWTSVAIGLAELAAPRQVEALLGLEDRRERRGILRVLGLRELMHGFSLLTEDKPGAAMRSAVWSRVAGDVLDTALLGVAGLKTKNPGRFAAVAASVMVIGLLDAVWATRLQEHHHHA